MARIIEQSPRLPVDISNQAVSDNGDSEVPTLYEKWGVQPIGNTTDVDVYAATTHIPESEYYLKPRGSSVKIESGGLPEVLNPYLQRLIFLTGGPSGPIGLQFVAQPDKETKAYSLEQNLLSLEDSLIEDEHEVAPGLINKYGNRGLALMTGKCAAYCRFCTRGRLVGKEKPKTFEEIDQAFEYIWNHPEMIEVIFSGGDPFVLRPEVFQYVIEHVKRLQKAKRLKSVRFGSRALFHKGYLEDHIYEGLSQIYKPKVMLHANHPSELTHSVKEGLDQLSDVKARLFSQSVFLGGVNDNRQTLKDLFLGLDEMGVTPYYLFDPDANYWSAIFKLPFERKASLYQGLRAELPGVAGSVRYVLDVPEGHGKIPVEEGFWERDKPAKVFRDFHKKRFTFDEYGNVIPYKETTVFQSAADYD